MDSTDESITALLDSLREGQYEIWFGQRLILKAMGLIVPENGELRFAKPEPAERNLAPLDIRVQAPLAGERSSGDLD